jgi:hypothetical protein
MVKKASKPNTVTEAVKYQVIMVLMSLDKPISFTSIEKFAEWLNEKDIPMTTQALAGMMKRAPDVFAKVKIEHVVKNPMSQLFNRMDTAESTLNNVCVGMKNHDRSLAELTELNKVLTARIKKLEDVVNG